MDGQFLASRGGSILASTEEILPLAAQEGEALVDAALRHALEEGEIGVGKLNVTAIRRQLPETASPVTDVAVVEVALASFDELLGGNPAGVTQ